MISDFVSLPQRPLLLPLLLASLKFLAHFAPEITLNLPMCGLPFPAAGVWHSRHQLRFGLVIGGLPQPVSSVDIEIGYHNFRKGFKFFPCQCSKVSDTHRSHPGHDFLTFCFELPLGRPAFLFFVFAPLTSLPIWFCGTNACWARE